MGPTWPIPGISYVPKEQQLVVRLGNKTEEGQFEQIAHFAHMAVHNILVDFILSAWERSVESYARSLALYDGRVRDGIQPHTPYFDVFSVRQQNDFLCYANAVYLLVTIFLFMYMKHRANGFKLRWILVIYDGSNVVLASYIALSILRYKLVHSSKIVCNELANDVEGYHLSWAFALFYLQKYYEFLDTWFFILRKSSRQVTFLHLFHHSSITVVVGSILPFDYNADMYLPILLNSANHTLLYLHYLLATLGLKSWWAPYITSMQLLQFCLIFTQSFVSYLIGPSCGTPDFAKVLMIVYMGSMIALFINFFMQKYVLRRPVQNLDMCGVVKRPHPLYPNVPSQYCGVAVLDGAGCCTVVLPEDFPDEERIVRETLRKAPFCVVYSLTPMHCAMPSLHIAREVGRISPQSAAAVVSAPSPAGNVSRANTNASGSAVKMSPNSATALAGTREKKRRSFGTGSRDHGTSGSPIDAAATTARTDVRVDNFRLLDVPRFSNANVVKSASISDFRLLPSQDGLAGSRNSSSGNLQLLHNDRLIDGPLPLSESFELINKYSQQIRAGISESIFRLTLGALAAEERGSYVESPDADKKKGSAAVSAATAAPVEEAEESVSICGALGAKDRAGNFSSGTSAGALDVGAGSVQAVPLSFVIAGGVAGGRVSWVVHTAPIISEETAAGGSDVAGDGAAAAVGPAAVGSDARPRAPSSTGIIRSSSQNAHAGLLGSTGSRGGSTTSLSGMEDVVVQQQRAVAAEYAEDYALDWRAIS